MANWKISEKEFDEEFDLATKLAKENDLKEQRAVKVKFDKKTRRIVLDLSNETTFIFPVNIVQGLTLATDEELSEVKITPSKSGLSWNNLDVHFSLVSLMAGMFGNKAWMSELGKLGGKAKTEQKAITSKENGKKGGRPKGSKTIVKNPSSTLKKSINDIKSGENLSTYSGKEYLSKIKKEFEKAK